MPIQQGYVSGLIDVSVHSTTTDPIDIGPAARMVGIIMADVSDTATISLQVAPASGGTYRALRKKDNSADWGLTATPAAPKAIYVEEGIPFRYFKVVSSVSQSVDVTFYLVTR